MIFKKSVMLPLIFFSIPAIAQRYPLTYHPDSGAYTVRLYVGKQHDPVDVVVDTGSSNLNFVSTQTKCGVCAFGVSKLSLSKAEISALNQQDYFDMRYGNGAGALQMYKGLVGFSKTRQVSTEFSVAKSGENLSSILGLAYKTIAAPQLYPLQPFFDTLQQHFHYNGFSLNLCAQSGKSYLQLGLKHSAKKSIQYTPIVTKNYYVVLLNGIYGKTVHQGYQPVVSFGPAKMLKTAVLDSGTTARVYLPRFAVHGIVDYIKKHTPAAADQGLPDSFWYQGHCLNKALIDRQQFPVLSFAFAKASDSTKSIYIDLTPKQYITSGGCGAFGEHFVFMQAPSSGGGARHKMSSYTPQLKILGTPLFEGYDVFFERKQGKEGRIGFAKASC